MSEELPPYTHPVTDPMEAFNALKNWQDNWDTLSPDIKFAVATVKEIDLATRNIAVFGTEEMMLDPQFKTIVSKVGIASLNVALCYLLISNWPAELENIRAQRKAEPSERDAVGLLLEQWTMAIDGHVRATIFAEFPTKQYHRDATIEVKIAMPLGRWIEPRRSEIVRRVEAGLIGFVKKDESTPR